MSEKLSVREKSEIVVNAGLNAIPYIGGVLSALYFGAKEEKRFKRLENFYNGLKERVETLEDNLLDIDKVDKLKLALIIEEINESVENDFAEKRIDYFQNCFINSITVSSENEYDKQRYFISLLLKLTDLDIEILLELYKVPAGHGFSYDQERVEVANEFNGSLEKLKSYGFLNSKLNGKLKPNIDWGEITLFMISNFGRNFVDYCLFSDGVNNK